MRKTIDFLTVAVFLGGMACRQAAESPKKIAVTTSSDEARALFIKARALVENNHSEEARPLLGEAIRLDPNFALAHLLRAGTATSTNEKVDHLKAALAAAGRTSDGEQLLIRATGASADGNLRAAGEYLTKLAAAYPGDERAHFRLGAYHYSFQRYDAAIEELQKATQVAPDYAPAYNMLGYALSSAQRDKDAEAVFRKYVELIPNEPNSHDSLAELLLKMGRFDESIDSYKKALSVDNNFYHAYEGIAANLMYQEKHNEAMEQLRKGFNAARNDNERQRMLRTMAVCNLDEGRLSAALAMLSKESALAEKQADSFAMAAVAFSRGDLLLDAGKIGEAETEFAKALELARRSKIPEGPRKHIEAAYHGDLALLAAARKDFATAAKEAEAMRVGFEELANSNGIRSAHLVSGMVALRQARYDEAISHLKQADQSSPYTMFQLGQAYAGKKDAANAKSFYEKAAKAYIIPRYNLRDATVRRAALKSAKK